MQLGGGRVTFLFAPGGAIEGDRVQLITYPMVWGGSDGARRGGVWIPVARRVLNIRSVLASISASASVFGNGRWQHFGDRSKMLGKMEMEDE